MTAAPRPRLLRWTRFASDPFGTGPEKRSAQIWDLAQSAGYEVSDMRPPASFPRLATWTAGIRAVWRHGRLASVDRAGAGLLGFRSNFYRQALDAHTGARVLLWETTYDDVLPALAHDRGFRVIALPHNLEARVTDRAFHTPGYDPTEDLVAEVRRLGRADAVFTISHEEGSFLGSHGVPATYLPYFPTGPLAVECAEIRARRAKTPPHGGPLLVLGSAFNPATARGMQRQLDWLSASAPDRQVVVAGPDSDRMFGPRASATTRVLGKISRPQLVELLATCTGLLVHTEGGAGAATRIPEALAAGVPVIANPNGARDQDGSPGVHVYQTREEFLRFATSSLPLPPAPALSSAASEQFAGALRRLAAWSAS